MSSLSWIALLFVVPCVLLAPPAIRTWGVVRGVFACSLLAAFMVGAWQVAVVLGQPGAGPANWASVASVSSNTCATCHPDHFESWHRTYHRTMTRDAASDTIKADFRNAVHQHQGVDSKFTIEHGEYYLETIDPHWEMKRVREKKPPGENAPTTKFKVDRVVGSHWIQEFMHRQENGRYMRLPILYHLGEQRWIHSHGGFLAPDLDDYWALARGTAWNETCLFCHNTGPAKNPVRGPRGELAGYETKVAELGISCEACHGPAADHIAKNRNPARRMTMQMSGAGDPSIVNPARLLVDRRDEVCARCHGATVPNPMAWDPRTVRDPFIPGQEMKRFNFFFWSEAEQRKLAGVELPKSHSTEPIDGRFWGDGTPLTTALEYNGMALSACYLKGKGEMSCLSCHELHGTDPNHMLKPRMRGNEACTQCHDEIGRKLETHTRHAADSAGSQCMNCHMPKIVYSLMAVHRSHRIENPSVEATATHGKPNGCNLCHLDKSLGWTQEQLTKNWGVKPVPLPEDERKIASSLTLLCQHDARTRVMVAGAFANPEVHQATGTDWQGPFLARLLEKERFPAVRYLLHKSLVGLPGLDPATKDAVARYDNLALAKPREKQRAELLERFDAFPIASDRPYLPLDLNRRPDQSALDRLRTKRKDPDLTINE